MFGADGKVDICQQQISARSGPLSVLLTSHTDDCSTLKTYQTACVCSLSEVAVDTISRLHPTFHRIRFMCSEIEGPLFQS